MLRRTILLLLVGLCASPTTSAAENTPPPDTLWVIPHTHWEGAVFKTREEYLEMGLPHILHALQLLEQHPDYTFVLDQVAYVKPFLERYPQHEGAFRKFVADGRLELVLGMNVMPDVNKPGPESLVRQIQYGKGYYRRKLGFDVTTAWLVDTFGHHAQMPQILKLGGYKSFWFFRGVPNARHPSEFLWEGIDGTRIPSVWLPHAYGLFYGAPGELGEFEKFARQRYDMLTPTAHGHDRVAPAGVDVSDPEEQLPVMMKAQQQSGHDLGFKLRFGVPSQFDAAVARRTDLPVFKGELNPIFQGTYSSRVELKQEMRAMERLLTTTEMLGVLADWAAPKPQAAKGDDPIWQAWEPVLFNQTHDLASGVMTDHVYDDVVRELDFARRTGQGLFDDRWERFASAIDTQGEGTPIIVFNTLGWPRTDIAQVTIGVTTPGVSAISIVDPSGAQVPVQLLSAVRGRDQGIREARVAFSARDVPAIGYSVYRAIPRIGQPTTAPELLVENGREAGPDAVLENEHYRLAIDRFTGAITRLQLKADGWNALGSAPANVIARQEDKGDLWELYHGLDGGSRFAMTTTQPVPRGAPPRSSAPISDPNPPASSALAPSTASSRSRRIPSTTASSPPPSGWPAAPIASRSPRA
jgi:alpha-mannosidase